MKVNLPATDMLICLFWFNLYSCNTNDEVKVINHLAENDSIRTVIYNSIGWAKNKDFDLLYNIIANDSNYLEVDPNPGIIKGFTQFRKNETLWSNPDFKAVRYDIRDLLINLSHCGDVAWFYCVLDDINEWKGKPLCWLNTRWTGVMEKRNQKWVMVQMHFSFAKEKSE
jgi:ketosteroid isomerase-like protein